MSTTKVTQDVLSTVPAGLAIATPTITAPTITTPTITTPMDKRQPGTSRLTS